MDTKVESVPQHNRPQTYLKRIPLSVLPELQDRLQRARGVLFAFAVAISSTALNILSYMAAATIHPSSVTLWTSTTMILLSVIALIIKAPAFPYSVKTVSYLSLGSFLGGGGSVTLLVGIMISEPADAVSLFFTLPVILIVLEAIVKRQNPKIFHLIFTICSVAGVVFIVQPPFLFERNLEVNVWGIGLGMSSALLQAGSMITMRELAENNLHPLILCFGISISIWVMSLSACSFFDGVTFPCEGNVLSVILSAGISHFAAYNVLYLALGAERPFIVSIIMTFEIVFTFVAQWIILNLAPSWYSAIGGLLITVACIGITLTKDDAGSRNKGEEEQHLLNG